MNTQAKCLSQEGCDSSCDRQGGEVPAVRPIVDRPLLTKCAADVVPVRQVDIPPMRWWRVDERRNVLVPRANGGSDYEVDLDSVDDGMVSRATERIADWIQQVGQKTWANPELVAEMALFLSTRIMERVWSSRGSDLRLRTKVVTTKPMRR